MTDSFTIDYFPIIYELEQKGLVTRTFRRLDPERQMAVIQAILDEAGENGPQDLNIKRVAERAGVSTGSLYQYFKNRDGLLLFAVELVTRITVKTFEGYRPYMAEIPLEQGLSTYLECGDAWTKEQLGFARFFGSAAYHGDPQLGETVVRPVAGVMRSMIEELLRAAVKRGELRPDLDIEAAGRVLHTLTIAIGDGLLYPALNNYYQLLDGEFPPERIYATFTDMILHGIYKEKKP